MRRSRETTFWVEDNIFFGITLGADFCSEHEWGVKTINSLFGIKNTDESLMGIERYTINEISANLAFLKKGKRKISEALLYFDYTNSLPKALGDKSYPGKDFFDRKWLFSYKEPEGATSAWDEGSFAIRGFTQEEINRIEEVYNAFLNKDIAIWVGGSGPFGGGGLHLIIASKMPDYHKQKLWADHVEDKRINDVVNKTGIKQELEAAGKKYYALKPGFFLDENGNEFIKFFLNPQEQNTNNYGWFTVEELQQWTKGDGPIPKTKEGANK